MLKQPSYAALNFLARLTNTPRLAPNSLFRRKNNDLLIVATELIGDNSECYGITHTPTPKCFTAVGVSCKNLFFLLVAIWYIFLIFLKQSHLNYLKWCQKHSDTLCESVCGCLCHVFTITSS